MDDYFEKGNFLYQQGQKSEALLCYNKSIELNPDDSDAYFNKGILLSDLGQKDEALRCFNKVIVLNPNYLDVYYNKGSLLEDLGQKSEAIYCYNMQIQLNPNCSDAYNNKGLLLVDLGQNKEALDCYSKAIELNSYYPNVYINKGNLLADLGQKNEALECYNKAIELNPNYLNAYNNKGVLLVDLGFQNEALQCYNKAIQLNPNYLDAHNNKGNLLTYLGKKNEALHCYNKVIELNPNDPNVYINKGNLLADLGQKNEALHCYNKAIELNPNGVLALANRAKYYSQNGDIQLVLSDIKKAVFLLNQGHVSGLSQGNIIYIQNTIKQFEDVQKSNKQITEKIQLIQGNEQEKTQLNQSVNKYMKIINKLEQNIVEQITNQVEISESIYPQKKEDLQKINDDLKYENLENKKKLLQLEQQLQKNDLKMQGVIQLIEQFTKRFENVENIIKNSDLKDEVLLNLELKDLQKEQDVLGYYHTFYWTSLNTLLTYRILSTGLIQANYKSSSTEFIESNKETISEGIKLGLDVGKEICKETIKAVPIIGDIFSYIDKVVDIVVNAGITYHDKQEYTQFQNRVSIISKVIMKKFKKEEEISRQLAQAAIQLAKLRKNDIKNNVTQEDDETDLKTKIFDKLQEIENIFFPKEEQHNKSCIAIKLALKDVTLLISYLYQNSQSIIDRPDPIYQIFVDLIQTKAIENQLNKNQLIHGNQVNIGTAKTIENYQDQSLSRPQNEPNCNCFLF